MIGHWREKESVFLLARNYVLCSARWNQRNNNKNPTFSIFFLFRVFVELHSISVHKHGKREIGQYLATLTWRLINNPYILNDDNILTMALHYVTQTKIFWPSELVDDRMFILFHWRHPSKSISAKIDYIAIYPDACSVVWGRIKLLIMNYPCWIILLKMCGDILPLFHLDLCLSSSSALIFGSLLGTVHGHFHGPVLFIPKNITPRKMSYSAGWSTE